MISLKWDGSDSVMVHSRLQQCLNCSFEYQSLSDASTTQLFAYPALRATCSTVGGNKETSKWSKATWYWILGIKKGIWQFSFPNIGFWPNTWNETRIVIAMLHATFYLMLTSVTVGHWLPSDTRRVAINSDVLISCGPSRLTRSTRTSPKSLRWQTAVPGVVHYDSNVPEMARDARGKKSVITWAIVLSFVR